LNVDLFATFAQSFESVKEEIRDLLHRALWHLRKASATYDLIEEFSELWMGLETINPLIQRRFGLSTTHPGAPCKKCGEVAQIVGTATRIRYAIVDVGSLNSVTFFL